MTTLFSALDWRAMSQEARDLGLNNGVAVPGSVEMVAGWEQRSAAMRKRFPGHLDLRYGPRERTRIDFLKAADNVRLFLEPGMGHCGGGEGPNVFDKVSALEQWVELKKAPDVMIASWCGKNGRPVGPRTPRPCAFSRTASGSSGLPSALAGRISISMALSHPLVRAGMAISGIYDLEPIRHSYLNEKLRADEVTSRRNSPMMQEGGPSKPLSLVVGSAELPLLRKQTADFAGHRARYGLPVTYEEIPDANHFTIMYEMMSPKGRITTLIRQLFERTTG